MMKHINKLIVFCFVVALIVMNQNCSGGLQNTAPGSINNASSDGGGGSAPPTTMPPTGGGGGATGPSTGAGLFPATSIWYQDISKAAKDSQSDTIINWLNSNGGWGTGSMKVDLSFNIQYVTSTTPFLSLQKSKDYYDGECDNLSTFPAPIGGAVEGYSGYTCSGGEDCHLLVVDNVNHKLYESYQTTVANNILTSTCAIVWDLNKVYPANLRGDGCTSTDAAGFPVTPLLFTADEIKAGAINHAIRFILPNKEIAAGVYVHPATHIGGPSGPKASAVPYGAHLRLKASTDISKLKPAAKVVAQALMKYGMFLSDGGNIALTAADDKYTTAKYSQLGFGTSDLTALKVTDFEMVNGGTRMPAGVDCKLNP
jgi:hypothetical protein